MQFGQKVLVKFMEIQKIIERLSEPEKLVSPEQINILQSYLNGYITDLEEDAWERQLVASNKLAELTNNNSAAKAEILWKISNEWRLWQGIEKTIKKLKRYRSDLKDRFQVLMGKKNYQYLLRRGWLNTQEATEAYLCMR